MCENIRAKFMLSAANGHEESSAIVSENRTLRSYFRRIRAVDQKSPIMDILAETVY